MESVIAAPISHLDLLDKLDTLYNFIRTLPTNNIEQIETIIAELKALDCSIKTKAEFKGESNTGHGPGRMLTFSESYIGEEICANCVIKIIHDDPDQWRGHAHNTGYDLTIYNKAAHDTLFPGNPKSDEEVIDLIGIGMYQETEFNNFKLDPATGLSTPTISVKNTSGSPYDSFSHSYVKDLDISNLRRRIDFKGHLWSTATARSTHKAAYILSLDVNCELHCYDVFSYPGTAIEKQIDVSYGDGVNSLFDQYKHIIRMYRFLSRYSWENLETMVTKFKLKLAKNV